MDKKNPKRDIRILMKMLEFITELCEGMEKYNIKHPTDLSIAKLDRLVRRGIIHVIADFTEAFEQMTDSTIQALNMNMALLKPFRNAVTHRYETVTDTMIYALMAYCTSRDTADNIRTVLATLQATEKQK